LERLLGPLAEEVGQGLRASVGTWALKRKIRFAQQAQRMIAGAGFTPAAVPPKILFRVVENASLEDDDLLQDRWAALLANAANPRKYFDVVGFIELLRQLSPREGHFLQYIYDSVTYEPAFYDVVDEPDSLGTEEELIRNFAAANESEPTHEMNDNARAALEKFVRLDMFVTRVGVARYQGVLATSHQKQTTHYFLTKWGWNFVKACQPPKRSA
jgi:abortive infection alpha-like protein